MSTFVMQTLLQVEIRLYNLESIKQIRLFIENCRLTEKKEALDMKKAVNRFGYESIDSDGFR